MSTAEIDRAVDAVRRGRLAVVPTDTVYGLVAAPDDVGAVRELSVLKGRPPEQPIAILAATVEAILTAVPELTDVNVAAARALLPGPYTLVLSNPGRRFPALTGGTAVAIGIRVPAVTGPGHRFLERAGIVAATSANLHGGPDPRLLDDVPAEMRHACATVDGGELPGRPSTVVDLTGPAPRVLREGAVPARQALERLAGVLGG